MSARRVTHIIDRLGIGGAEQLLVTAAAQAANVGWRMRVLSLAPPDDSTVARRLVEHGVEVDYAPSMRERTLMDTDRLRGLRSLIAKGRPEVVHTHLRFSNILGPAACAGMPVTRVATLHSIATDDSPHARDGLERWSLRHGFHARIAVGPAVGSTQAARIGRLVRVLPNPVAIDRDDDPASLTALRQQVLDGSPGPLVLTAGRLTEAKGLPDLIRAFALVRRRFPGAVLAIAGSGELLGALRYQAAEAHMDDAVRFLGARSDVPSLMRAADLFVLSSVQEGLPLVVLEAMAAGLPIVATDVGDIAYALDGNGMLVPPRKYCELAAAMARLLADPWLACRLGADARRSVELNHSTRAWAERMDALYSSLARARHG